MADSLDALRAGRLAPGWREVRAFGCLLEELAARCDPADGEPGARVDLMRALARRCMQPDAA
jgi:hypothetical protein